MPNSRKQTRKLFNVICSLAAEKTWPRLEFQNVLPELRNTGLPDESIMEGINEMVARDHIMTFRRPGPDSLEDVLFVQPTKDGWERYAPDVDAEWEERPHDVAVAIVEGKETLEDICDAVPAPVGLVHHLLMNMETEGQIVVSRSDTVIRITEYTDDVEEFAESA